MTEINAENTTPQAEGAKNPPAEAKSVFPNCVVDRAWFTRHSTREHIEDCQKVQDMIMGMVDGLIVKAKEPGFDEASDGAIEGFRENIVWLFERLNSDAFKLKQYTQELDGSR